MQMSLESQILQLESICAHLESLENLYDRLPKADQNRLPREVAFETCTLLPGSRALESFFSADTESRKIAVVTEDLTTGMKVAIAAAVGVIVGLIGWIIHKFFFKDSKGGEGGKEFDLSESIEKAEEKAEAVEDFAAEVRPLASFFQHKALERFVNEEMNGFLDGLTDAQKLHFNKKINDQLVHEFIEFFRRYTKIGEELTESWEALEKVYDEFESQAKDVGFFSKHGFKRDVNKAFDDAFAVVDNELLTELTYANKKFKLADSNPPSDNEIKRIIQNPVHATEMFAGALKAINFSDIQKYVESIGVNMKPLLIEVEKRQADFKKDPDDANTGLKTIYSLYRQRLPVFANCLKNAIQVAKIAEMHAKSILLTHDKICSYTLKALKKIEAEKLDSIDETQLKKAIELYQSVTSSATAAYPQKPQAEKKS